MTLIHEFCEKLGVKKSLQKHLPELRKGVREHEKPNALPKVNAYHSRVGE